MNPVISSAHSYGWMPDLPDQRDFAYKKLSLLLTIPSLPPHIDLRHECTPIEDQGNLGSCTAQALVGNLEFLKKKTLGKTMNFSRLFVYYNERLNLNSVASDSGATLRVGIKMLVKLGDCLEALWSYQIDQFAKKPSSIAYTEALKHQVTGYYRITSLGEMKHTLMTGHPFVFGFTVYESLETPGVTKTGSIPLPQSDEHVLGGHAVMAVGYDDTKNVFLIRNSWGTSWGKNGYGTIPYAYLENRKLSSDFWTIRTME